MAKNNYETAVFVSYAWGGESERIVDELERAFAERDIRVLRDKKELGYKGSVEAFERRIGQGQCVVLVIGDKYLRSEHCMYELVEVNKNRNLHDRIFPIVLAEAKIYRPIDRLSYIKHWDEKIEQLDHAIKEIKVMTNLSGITADLDKYANIRASFDNLTDLLSDMNALTPELQEASGFSTLINAIEYSLAGKRTTFQPRNVTAQRNKVSDSTSKQTQNITINSRLAQVTIIIEKDIHKFTDNEKDGIVFVVSKLTGVSLNQIRILQVVEGSVKVMLEMPETGARQLMKLFLDGNSELKKLQIKNIKITKSSTASKYNALELAVSDTKTVPTWSDRGARPDDIINNRPEQLLKLEEELDRLKMEKNKMQVDLEEIEKIDKESRRIWVTRQLKLNIIDAALDSLQAHYEKELGIDDDE